MTGVVKKTTLAVFALAAVGMTSAQQCPISEAEFRSFDFSGVLNYCGDLESTQGCDTCYAAIVYPMRTTLDYIDTDTSFQQFGLDVADLLELCQDNFVSGLIDDLGIFQAAQLRGLEECGFEFGQYPQTVKVVTDYYESQGVDTSKIQP